jgi:hypothetical protein
MKKLLLFFVILLVGFTSIGQITFTQSDIAGQNYFLCIASDSLPDSTISIGGTDYQSWDFSALDIDVIDTLAFTDPLLLTGSISFPLANLGISFTGQSFPYTHNEFYNINYNSLDLLGAYSHNGCVLSSSYAVAHYTPYDRVFQFPVNYPSSAFFVSNISDNKYECNYYAGCDSIRKKDLINKIVTIDAFGNMTTPLGTFNTIRQNEVISVTDSFWKHQISPPGWQFIIRSSENDSHVSWIANGMGYPIVEIYTWLTVPPIIYNVKWLKTYPVYSSSKETAFSNGINIYPNPASDMINIQVSEQYNKIKSLEIFDCIGQLQLEKKDDFRAIDISSLPCGLYFIVLTNIDNKRLTGKIVKE